MPADTPDRDEQKALEIADLFKSRVSVAQESAIRAAIATIIRALADK
jgi:hypothetical protein